MGSIQDVYIFPVQIQPESLAIPGDNGLRLDYRETGLVQDCLKSGGQLI
jgi:hypothetical protein